MTKRIAWVIDSTTHLSNKLKNHPDIFSVPLNVHFGDEQFADGIDLTSEQLYNKINNAKEIPKTSQPSAGQFAAMYKEIAKNYDEAIAIHLSDQLSGTLSSSKSGAEITGFPVTFIDSLSLSYGTTALVEHGIDLYESGATVETIQQTLTEMAGTIQNYILIGSLEQLYKGGRVSGMQFFLGNLLKIKLIIQASPEGKLVPIDKIRSEKRAIQYLLTKMEDAYANRVRKFFIMQGNILEKARHLEQLMKEKMPEAEVEIGEIGSVLAVHAGEGTLAVLWGHPETK